MAEIAVVGAGLGGLAVAVRLAKQGHRVSVLERAAAPGGLLRQIAATDATPPSGLSWDAIPFRTSVPAVLRDLFRKSGRPIEGYVDLQLMAPARRHVFPDGAVVDLPGGSRGGQQEAIASALGAAAADRWTRFVDDQADAWQLLRTSVLDRAEGSSPLAARRLWNQVAGRGGLGHRLRAALPDRRLQEMAAYPALWSTGGRSAAGRSTAGRSKAGRSKAGRSKAGRSADAPGFLSVEPYLERTLGVWTATGGALDLARALVERCSERGVDIAYGADVTSLLMSGGERVTGIRLRDGTDVCAETVVCAVDPRAVFDGLLGHPVAGRLRGLLEVRGRPGPGSRTVHLALDERPAELPAGVVEVVSHGDPLLSLHLGPVRGGLVTSTIVGAGWPEPAEDPVEVLAGRGIDVRPLVRHRVDRTEPRGAVPWAGRRATAARAAATHPVPGLFCLGADLPLGPSVSAVCWQAADLAGRIGKAERHPRP